jgi:hypothetical protein
MARRGTVVRRSRIEWCARIGIAFVALVSAYAAVAHTFAYTIRAAAPAQAHEWAPKDGRLTGLLAQQMSGPGAAPADRSRADVLADLALRQDPTAIAAVVALGINAEVRGDIGRARHMFAYANILSRRDLPTRLWAIEDAIGRGDIPGALRQYDIALRTSRTAPNLLFPILGSAIADPAIRTALTARLRTRPTWAGPFIVYLADDGKDTSAAALLFRSIARAGLPLPDGPRAVLLRRLVEEGKFDDAWNMYAAVTPGAYRRWSRDPHFTAKSDQPSVFDWTPVEVDGTTAVFQRGDNGNVFDFAVPSGMGGPILRQLQLLPPGEYSIEGRSTGIDQIDSALPYWVLSCENGTEIGRVTVTSSNRAGGRFAGGLNVPARCPVQYLTLVVRPSERVEGVVGQIKTVILRPARI